MNDNTLLRHIAALLYAILCVLVIIAYALISTAMMPESVRCVVLAGIFSLSGMYTFIAIKGAFNSSGR